MTVGKKKRFQKKPFNPLKWKPTHKNANNFKAQKPNKKNKVALKQHPKPTGAAHKIKSQYVQKRIYPTGILVIQLAIDGKEKIIRINPPKPPSDLMKTVKSALKTVVVDQAVGSLVRSSIASMSIPVMPYKDPESYFMFKGMSVDVMKQTLIDASGALAQAQTAFLLHQKVEPTTMAFDLIGMAAEAYITENASCQCGSASLLKFNYTLAGIDCICRDCKQLYEIKFAIYDQGNLIFPMSHSNRSGLLIACGSVKLILAIADPISNSVVPFQGYSIVHDTSLIELCRPEGVSRKDRRQRYGICAHKVEKVSCIKMYKLTQLRNPFTGRSTDAHDILV